MTNITPPQIAGTWRITKTIVVEQVTPTGSIDFITNTHNKQDVEVLIRQNGELVAVEYLNSTPYRPVLNTRLGVW